MSWPTRSREWWCHALTSTHWPLEFQYGQYCKNPSSVLWECPTFFCVIWEKHFPILIHALVKGILLCLRFTLKHFKFLNWKTCQHMWPSMGKPGQSRQAKFGEKGESVKKKFFFLVKMPLWYTLSIPKCRNIFRSALKLHLMSLKLIVFQYNSFIQTYLKNI
jgi:hypothetical protein